MYIQIRVEVVGRDTLTTFLDEVNNFHLSIKFTVEISTKQHVFLDTKSSLVGDLYTKPTDTHQHQHLLSTSATRNTAAKMFLTALHFASDVSAPIRTLLNQEQENRLTTSANGVIRNRKFHLPLREDLFSYRPKSESRVLPFVSTYHPDILKVRDIVNKTGPSLSPLALRARSSQKDRP